MRPKDSNTNPRGAEQEIDLLRESRTRLIADVVTGKLDVREAAARLPQEAEDLEPLDDEEHRVEDLRIRRRGGFEIRRGDTSLKRLRRRPARFA